MFIYSNNVIRKFGALAACICLAFAMSISAFADVTTTEIKVTCSEPCMVGLTGVSENTEGFSENRECTDSVGFSLSLSEPGQYEYELKQASSGQYRIYDDTIYQVFVDVFYEDDKMVSVVTGGIKGTEEKPEEFRFEGLPTESGSEKPEDEEPKPKPEEKTRKTKIKERPKGLVEVIDNAIPFGLPVLTGDDTDIAIWILLICVSATGIAGILYINGRNRPLSKGTSPEAQKGEDQDG